MKAFPDLKGMCLCKDKGRSLCNALNFFDDGLEKMNSIYCQNIEMKRFSHSTTIEIVHFSVFKISIKYRSSIHMLIQRICVRTRKCKE